jgi:chitin disaccharide deacetylase
MNGLLIVNADDWGGSEATTDAILETFRAGRVTSTSGMVYMEDSDRAAAAAREARIPVGLHLNLTQPFSDPATPEKVLDRQRRLAGSLAGEGSDRQPGTAKLRRWLYDPGLRAEVDRAVADQIERFEALYGRPPTHFDGHNYVDVCPNVFLSRAIPAGSRMRNSLNRFPLERTPMAVARTLRQGLRSKRFASPRYVLHITELQLPANGPIDPRLELAKAVPIEVMGHPDNQAEHEILMSARWGECLGEFDLGSFADLDPGRTGWGETFRRLPARP